LGFSNTFRSEGVDLSRASAILTRQERSEETVIMAATASTFSYAQAAKGQSTPKNSVDQAQTVPIKSNEQEADTNAQVHNPEVLNAISTDESNTTQLPESAPSKNMELEEKTVISTLSDSSSSKNSDLGTKDSASVSSSPNVSGDDVQKSVKEDGTAGISGESDTTWENLSGRSQVDNLSSKAESVSNDLKPSDWVEVKPHYKEAPIPAVNIWEKRKLDAQAKTKDSKPANVQPKPKTSEGAVNGGKEDQKARPEKGRPVVKENGKHFSILQL
jgi:la-related protein 1